jgi:predicted dehydrogenase
MTRLGFLGLGWIGCSRLQAIAADGVASVTAIADSQPQACIAAQEVAPGAMVATGLDELLGLDLDGIVIATPSALHAQQARKALEAGVAVFCQKPLGRTGAETSGVIDSARRSDRLLGVDFSYRDTRAMAAVHEMVRGGDIGEVYSAELVFHNAYGPDKAWFHQPALSGGGCVMDLGIHLVDLALWMFDAREVVDVSSRLFARGRLLSPDPQVIEDHAVAQLDLPDGKVVSLACSWNLPAGCDAVIAATFYGTGGAARFRNVDGSFYDFVAERLDGTRSSGVVAPPDDWSGRTAVAWARRLASDPGFDPSIEDAGVVASVLDRIYRRGEPRSIARPDTCSPVRATDER